MAIEITHVRFDGQRRAPEVIVAYQWVSRDNGSSGQSDKPTLVAWVAEGNKVYVGNGANQVNVGVVDPSRGAAYLRTHADGRYNNNLENLPTF
ncbi:DUF3892 domain-containing protein [Microbacterium sp. 22215]|uniref:DUF3892 domain-containing protein n=1 Tax=Microbacterium sp. 22215 TaxID=3453893 RepID=UPI003F82A179